MTRSIWEKTWSHDEMTWSVRASLAFETKTETDRHLLRSMTPKSARMFGDRILSDQPPCPSAVRQSRVAILDLIVTHSLSSIPFVHLRPSLWSRPQVPCYLLFPSCAKSVVSKSRVRSCLPNLSHTKWKTQKHRRESQRQKNGRNRNLTGFQTKLVRVEVEVGRLVGDHSQMRTALANQIPHKPVWKSCRCRVLFPFQSEGCRDAHSALSGSGLGS
jgi:hypothetical protein